MSDQQSAVIQALLAYYEAFNTFEVQAILPSFHEPALLIAPSGAFAAPTHDVLAPVLKATIYSLRQTGWGRSELRVGRVESLSAVTSVATGTAIRYKVDGQELERVGATYVLQNADGCWRIAVVIMHDTNAARGDS